MAVGDRRVARWCRPAAGLLLVALVALLGGCNFVANGASTQRALTRAGYRAPVIGLGGMPSNVVVTYRSGPSGNIAADAARAELVVWATFPYAFEQVEVRQDLRLCARGACATTLREVATADDEQLTIRYGPRPVRLDQPGLPPTETVRVVTFGVRQLVTTAVLVLGAVAVLLGFWRADRRRRTQPDHHRSDRRAPPAGAAPPAPPLGGATADWGAPVRPRSAGPPDD